jgi:hypothetical protein
MQGLPPTQPTLAPFRRSTLHEIIPLRCKVPVSMAELAVHLVFHIYIFSIMAFLSDTVSVFETGSLFMTSTVFGATCEHRPFASFIRQCISRHQSGDWGDCCPDDAALNDAALLDGSRVFSVYFIPAGLYTLESKVWIITESSREYTTVLFPSEY